MTHLRRATSGPNLHPLELEALALLAVNTTHDAAARAMGSSARTYRRLLNQATEKLRARGPVHAACLAVSARLLVPHTVGTGFRPNPNLLKLNQTATH